MDQDVGLGTDSEGLCGPYKEEFGFLCLYFRMFLCYRPLWRYRRYGSSSRLAVGILFCYLSNSAICFLSPNNNLMLLALHTDLFHTSLAKIMPCWNYTVETCSCEVCFELAKGDSLRRNDLKALIVKHQLFWYLPKFCAVSCDWCEKNQYMGKLCFDQHKLNLSISPLYFLFPAFPIYYISLHIRGLRIPQQ